MCANGISSARRRELSSGSAEDPTHVHPDTGYKGDNDPLDVCEIGMLQLPTGSVTAVKVLGVLAMVDDGETDWKVVAISATDKWAGKINTIADLESALPGTLHAIREWFRLYKVPDGCPENIFALDEVSALKPRVELGGLGPL